MEKTLKEHLAAALKARWAKADKEKRAEHARMMNAARWGKAKEQDKEHGAPESASTGELESPTAELE